MNFFRLTSENFLMYAVKNYNNPEASGSKDFNKDMKTFVYLKKFFNRMRKVGLEEVNVQIPVNHIIVLMNLFGPKCTARLLFSYFEEAHWPAVAALLSYLRILPPSLPEIPDTSKIHLDPNLLRALEEL